jgi:hypothetical protein
MIPLTKENDDDDYTAILELVDVAARSSSSFMTSSRGAPSEDMALDDDDWMTSQHGSSSSHHGPSSSQHGASSSHHGPSSSQHGASSSHHGPSSSQHGSSSSTHDHSSSTKSSERSYTTSNNEFGEVANILYHDMAKYGQPMKKITSFKAFFAFCKAAYSRNDCTYIAFFYICLHLFASCLHLSAFLFVDLTVAEMTGKVNFDRQLSLRGAVCANLSVVPHNASYREKYQIWREVLALPHEAQTALEEWSKKASKYDLNAMMSEVERLQTASASGTTDTLAQTIVMVKKSKTKKDDKPGSEGKGGNEGNTENDPV